jgi:hypothetical protein
MICPRSPQRDSAGTVGPELRDDINPVVTTRKDYAMAGVKLCGEQHPDREDEKCVRRERHEGRHRGRRGLVWKKTGQRPQYRRYVPPHRREEGAAEPFGRRYRRPNSANPSPWEGEDLPVATEG